MYAYKVKISIKGSKPPVYKTIAIPEGTPLTEVSREINFSFGWSGYHAHEYLIGKYTKIIPNEMRSFCDYECGIEDDYTFDQVASRSLKYIYDFGDYWVHTFRFLKPIENYEHDYPMLINEKGENPIEDCGGVYALNEIRRILADPDDPEYDEYVEMYGDCE